jgi:excinuclease ABC subunit A
VVTGVSGSGKSSLAFDTIYAEGQRRYVESLSAYARQFLERMEKPDVDEIDGIAPAGRHPPEEHHAQSALHRRHVHRAATIFCACSGRARRPAPLPQLRHARRARHVDQVAARLLAQPEGSRWYALFPVRRARQPAACATTVRAAQEGLQPALSGRRIFEFSTPESLLDIDFSSRSSCWWTASRSAPDLHQRLVDTVEICYREAGEVIFERAARRRCASTRSSVQDDGMEFAEPEPILFSFNSALRRLPALPGLRQHHRFRHGPGDSRPHAVARRRRRRSVDQAAIQSIWPNFRSSQSGKVRFDVPFCDLTEDERELVDDFVRRFFDHLETKKYKLHVRVFLSRYRGYALCPDCGARACAKKRCTCAWAARTWPRWCA